MSPSAPAFALDAALLGRPGDVVALGAAKREQILRVSDWPAAGRQTNVDLLAPPHASAGGCACTVARTVARLGGRSALISALGDGESSQPIWRALSQAGVDAAWVRRLTGHDGNLLMILTNPAGDWVVMQYNDPAIVLSLAQLPEVDALARYTFLHIDGFAGASLDQQPIVAAALARARAAGCLISIDAAVPVAQAQPGYVAELFRQCDIAFANETEALLITGAAHVSEAIERLQRLGPRLCVLKLGAAGSWLIGRDAALHVPAYQVAVVDTIAAGDTYIGALLGGLCQGQPLAVAAQQASAAGALACCAAGSGSTSFSARDVQALIARGAALPC